MADPFLAEIRIVGFLFAPKGWAACDGQVLPTSQNTALFSLLGATYGGNGQTTFALPNLQDRAALHAGQGPSLTNQTLGQVGGQDTVTLTSGQMPAHTHQARAVSTAATLISPAGTVWASSATRPFSNQAPNTAMASTAMQSAGSSGPHNNRQPYLALQFLIALTGIYPSHA
jgi:microcystin-dependent protein